MAAREAIEATTVYSHGAASRHQQVIVKKREAIDALQVGDGITICGWSDRYAATITKKTAKTILAQRDDATLLNGANSDEEDKLQFTPGGFVGHTSGEQRYEYARNSEGSMYKITLRKCGRWVQSGCRPQQGGLVIPGRHEHYDYNF